MLRVFRLIEVISSNKKIFLRNFSRIDLFLSIPILFYNVRKLTLTITKRTDERATENRFQNKIKFLKK